MNLLNRAGNVPVILVRQGHNICITAYYRALAWIVDGSFAARSCRYLDDRLWVLAYVRMRLVLLVDLLVLIHLFISFHYLNLIAIFRLLFVFTRLLNSSMLFLWYSNGLHRHDSLQCTELHCHIGRPPSHNWDVVFSIAAIGWLCSKVSRTLLTQHLLRRGYLLYFNLDHGWSLGRNQLLLAPVENLGVYLWTFSLHMNLRTLMLFNLALSLVNFSLQEAFILDKIFALELWHDVPLGFILQFEVRLVLCSRLQTVCSAWPWQKLGRYGALRRWVIVIACSLINGNWLSKRTTTRLALYKHRLLWEERMVSNPLSYRLPRPLLLLLRQLDLRLR